MIRSRLSVDLVFRVPNVHQRAHVEFGQFFAALEPSLYLTALLFIDRAATGQADETVIFAANIAQTVDLDGFVQEGFQKRIDRLGFETITVVRLTSKPNSWNSSTQSFLRKRRERLVAIDSVLT